MADIAIDLGTQNIRIYTENKGVIINEPCIVAVDNYNGNILAIGNEAYSMLGRTSDRISVIYPLINGVISNFELVEQVISYFLKKASSNKLVMPRVVACIPGEITEVEKRAIVDSISASGVRKICLIEESVAAAMGSGIDIFTPHGVFIADIGAGTTEIAVISLSGVSVMKSIKLAGNDFNSIIIKHIKRKHKMIIGEVTAEALKKEIGCVYPQDEVCSTKIRGRNALTGLPQTIEINSKEILPIISGVAVKISNAIKETLEDVPPELLSDIFEDGMILTGGAANMKGFDELISEKTKLKVKVADEPELCTIKGVGESLKFIDIQVNHLQGKLNPLIIDY